MNFSISYDSDHPLSFGESEKFRFFQQPAFQKNENMLLQQGLFLENEWSEEWLCIDPIFTP